LKYNKQLILLLLIFIGCEDLPDLSQNPFEAIGDGQVPEILYLDKNINGNQALLKWSGNLFALGFSYKLSYYNSIFDNYSILNDWSDWTLDSSVDLTYLDEGMYRFYVRTHFDFEKEDTDSIDFNINNIDTNSMRVYPLIQYINNSQDFYIEVFLEEVSNISGVSLDIGFYSSDIKCENFIWGPIINQINFSNESISITPDPIIDLGSVKLDVAFSGGGFTGSGSIIKLIFSSNSNWSQTDVFINSAKLFDFNGAPIEINELVNGIINKIND
jgi:hypothetical protein